LIDFIEDDNIGWAVVVAGAVEQDVAGNGLTMDIVGVVDAFAEALEGLEGCVVVLAVDVSMIEFNDRFTYSFHNEMCDTGFPDAGGIVQEN